MTDDVVEGRLSEPRFRRAIVWLVGGRLAGTVLAQLLLVPAAVLATVPANPEGCRGLSAATSRDGAKPNRTPEVCQIWRTTGQIP